MTRTRAMYQGVSVGLKDRVETDEWIDGQTDTTDCFTILDNAVGKNSENYVVAKIEKFTQGYVDYCTLCILYILICEFSYQQLDLMQLLLQQLHKTVAFGYFCDAKDAAATS